MIVPPCAVESPSLAANFPPICTVVDPMIMLSGGPLQVAISPTHAAGIPPIKTVGHPGGKMGPPTCGTVPVTIGQTCISDTLAANGIFLIYLNQGTLQFCYGATGQFNAGCAISFETGLCCVFDIFALHFDVVRGFKHNFFFTFDGNSVAV